MNRRNFLRAASLVGSSLGASSAASQTESQNAAANKQKTKTQAYYEFSPDGRECIVKRQDTPIPWMNLLSNDDFQTWITHQGNIESFLLDRGLGGLTNPQEISGFVYLRDRATGRYFMLNRKPHNGSWQTVHGLGYTTVTAEALDLRGRVTYFVPREDSVLVWIIGITNQTEAEREIDVFSTVEWNLGDQNKQMVFRGHGGGGDGFTGASQFNLYKKVNVEDGIMYAIQNVWRTLGLGAKPWPYTGFLASSEPIQGHDCIKTEFLGHERSVENPIAVEVGGCSNTNFWSLNQFPWGAIQNTVRVPAQAERSLVIVLGMARDKRAIPALGRKYFQNPNGELERVHRFWREFTDRTINIETPEKEVDRQLNIWSKYQWRVNMLKSLNNGQRSLGFWSYGLMNGRIGGSIREVAVQPHDLEILRESLMIYMQGQFRDFGSHMFSESQPLMLFSDLEYQWPPKPSHDERLPHSHEADNAYAFCLYLKETGDLSFLEQSVPFVDGGEGTVFDHLANNVDYSLRALSPRGLPLLNKGIGDWNDELNMISREGRGETIMFAMTICFTLRECAAIAWAAGRNGHAKRWMESYEALKTVINRDCWDGDWYLRAFADGEGSPIPIGSAGNEEGKIYLNTQSWAVLSGVADSERARKCMDSTEKHLMSDYGPLIYAPAYSRFDKHVGVASTYAPGWRNACVYLRPVGWAIIAACEANRPDLAFKMYKNADLTARSKNVELFEHEPYAYPENYVGPGHPMAGKAQYQWCLGEGANWMWHSYVYYVLGIRPVLEGLKVDPKIPSQWPGFRVKREFRGARYEIEVMNPRRRSMGVRSIMVDGKRVNGNLIPPHRDGRVHVVHVELEG